MAVPCRLRPNRRAAIVICGLLALVGCGGYGTVSEKCYAYAQSLYTICNRRLDTKLAEVKKRIQEDVAAGRLPDHEGKWLHAIVDDAEGGEWKKAMHAARAMVRDQAKPL
jgi:hypothetical protein